MLSSTVCHVRVAFSRSCRINTWIPNERQARKVTPPGTWKNAKTFPLCFHLQIISWTFNATWGVYLNVPTRGLLPAFSLCGPKLKKFFFYFALCISRKIVLVSVCNCPQTSFPLGRLHVQPATIPDGTAGYSGIHKVSCDFVVFLCQVKAIHQKTTWLSQLLISQKYGQRHEETFPTSSTCGTSKILLPFWQQFEAIFISSGSFYFASSIHIKSKFYKLLRPPCGARRYAIKWLKSNIKYALLQNTI